MRSLVWFRGKDVRLGDHAPLQGAIESGEVIPLFVLDPYFFAPERARELPHRIQFLLEGISSLAQNLRTKGSDLLVVRGPSIEVVPRLAKELRVDQVLAYRWTEPFGRKRDEIIRARLVVPFRLYEGETLLPPGTVRTQAGAPFSVYTPFARAARAALSPLAPRRAPAVVPPLPEEVRQRPELFEPIVLLKDLGISPNPRLLSGGERQARARLDAFTRARLVGYAEGRDDMGSEGTSRLSPDLKFGTLSVAHVWNRVAATPASESRERFQAQLLWREFAYSILWDRPRVLEEPFRPEFSRFPWGFEQNLWDAWATGQTGYPLVDASARQLLSEGYVHNRARMVSASFLTKHLLIDYRHGEAHYLKYLTDGDFALNNLGWQWSAGCGVDAQPYFRVFNPVAQGARFDPRGLYVRKFVPELRQLPDKFIHAPWTAPGDVLLRAGVHLGRTYPVPIVDHAEARARFLAVAKDTLR